MNKPILLPHRSSRPAAIAAAAVSLATVLFTVVLLTAVLVSEARAEEGERLEIVDRAIEFHGGDLYLASETELDICSKSGCFDVLARLEGERYFYDVAGEVRGLHHRVRSSNDDLELLIAGSKMAHPPEETQGLRDWAMARVYFAFLPFRLNDPSVVKEDLGLETWDGRELHKVKVTFAAGSSSDASDEYLYWFDPETARVEQFAYSFEGNPGGLRFRRGHNYRRVEGILFFDQENLGVEGEGLTVDLVTPGYVDEKMRQISSVELRNVEVRPLEPAGQ